MLLLAAAPGIIQSVMLNIPPRFMVSGVHTVTSRTLSALSDTLVHYAVH